MSATRAFVSNDENYFDVGQNHRLYFRDYPGAQDATPIICLPRFWRNARDSRV